MLDDLLLNEDSRVKGRIKIVWVKEGCVDDQNRPEIFITATRIEKSFVDESLDLAELNWSASLPEFNMAFESFKRFLWLVSLRL